MLIDEQARVVEGSPSNEIDRLDHHWPKVEAAFQSDFCKYVDKLIKEARLRNESESEIRLSSDALPISTLCQQVKE